MPLDEGAVGLDHLEDVGAAGCEGHGCCLLVRYGNGGSGGGSWCPEGGCFGRAMGVQEMGCRWKEMPEKCQKKVQESLV